jgi:biotin synthase
MAMTKTSIIDKRLEDLFYEAMEFEGIGPEGAMYLATLPNTHLHDLLFLSNKIRECRREQIDLCSIVNAKCGRCSEDCAFCAQSSWYNTSIKTYPLLSKEEILRSSQDAASFGVKRFGIVTSGVRLRSLAEIERVCEAISMIKSETRIEVCASLGQLSRDQAKKLKEAGLIRYHHNLETDRAFFHRICTTHSFSDRVKTIRIAKAEGLEVCCGGIFGVGESWENRLNLAYTLKELDVDSIPLNFLNPIKGTPLGDQSLLPAFEILKIIAVFRFIHPHRDIKVCGGREVGLRDLQSWMYYAGANGTLIGNYLTTSGRLPEEDIQMLHDLGLSDFTKHINPKSKGHEIWDNRAISSKKEVT